MTSYLWTTGELRIYWGRKHLETQDLSDYQVPFCPDLRRLYFEEARKTYDGRVHSAGVIVQDDPGGFETTREDSKYETDRG